MSTYRVLVPACLVVLVVFVVCAGPDGARAAVVGAAGPSIFIERQTECVDEAALRRSLRQVLDEYRGARHMMVAVVIAPAVDGTLASLRVVMALTGEIVLDRQLKLAQADCANAHRFIAVVLEQFLTEFPIDDWIRENVPRQETGRPASEEKPSLDLSAAAPQAKPRFLRWLLFLSLDGRLPSPSGDLDLGTGIDVGAGRHGFITGLGARLGYPHSLDEGQYVEASMLFNAGWRYSLTPKLNLRTKIRVGPLLIDSFGYAVRYQNVLPWLEGEMSLAWQIGPVRLGPLIGVSPLRHSVSTTAGTRRGIPWLRVGIVVAVPLTETTLK